MPIQETALARISSSEKYAKMTGVMQEKKDQFLKMMMTELTHQNPLDPINQNDFLKQLIQIESTNDMITAVAEFIKAVGVLKEVSMVGFLGKQVLHQSNSLLLKHGQESFSISYALNGTRGKKVKAEISLLDRNGVVVHSERIDTTCGEDKILTMLIPSELRRRLNMNKQEEYTISLFASDDLTDTQISGKVYIPALVTHVMKDGAMHLDSGKAVNFDEVLGVTAEQLIPNRTPTNAITSAYSKISGLLGETIEDEKLIVEREDIVS